jgi:phosphopantothenoylcysteine decarboxylase/phosphopantothenate--cysteine ligase
LCVTGSIAAFKSPVIARLLLAAGAEVQVVFSRAAREFIGPATFAGITGKPVLGDMFDRGIGGELHVELGAESSLVLVAPASADLLSRLAAGRASDTITATALCARCRVMLAPAMHPAMWAHPATQRNVTTLSDDGRVLWVGPVHGEVANGETGVGRMAEPEEIVSAVIDHLSASDLSDRHLVVTAGPTVEDLDPVRYLGNRSSGKMGFALAARAAARGARVTLIAGPVALPTPAGVQRVDVRSATAMRDAVWHATGTDLSHTDALIMAAAVSDYRPRETFSSKLKRGPAALSIDLVQNPDILAEVGKARHGPRPLLVGFAVETATPERVIANARDKLSSKGVDLVVANHADDALGRDDNRAILVEPDREEPLPRASKGDLADRILDWVARRFTESG